MRHKATYLFNVKDNEILYGCNHREKRAIESPNPANGLPINDFQHIIRDGKLLQSKPTEGLKGTMGDHQPKEEEEEERLCFKVGQQNKMNPIISNVLHKV